MKIRKNGPIDALRKFLRQAVQEELSYEQYLLELAQRECEARRVNKIARLVKSSGLPLEKTLENFDLKRMPLKIRQQVKILLEGSFVDRNENLLAFGHRAVARRIYFVVCAMNWPGSSVASTSAPAM